jgi:acetyltransferase-like isoleucine patch superfamily enzyme
MNKRQRLLRLITSTLDPRPWVNVLRLVNHYNYDHVAPRRRMRCGSDVQLSPTISLRNGERIEVGSRSRIGDDCALWAGDESGRIVIGEDCLFGPQVYITASNYRIDPGTPVYAQPKEERDVVIGDCCWLGARVLVLAGVTLGAGCVVGAGSVVTQSLPPNAIAVGVPARVVKVRGDTAALAEIPEYVPSP